MVLRKDRPGASADCARMIAASDTDRVESTEAFCIADGVLLSPGCGVCWSGL